MIYNSDIARAIYLALKDKTSAEAHKTHESILNFLVRKRLMQKTEAILRQLKKVVDFENGIVSATILSAHRIHEKEKKDIVRFLKKRYAAKEVELTHILDKKLLGGVRLEVNDEVINSTLKNQITQLEEYLTKPT